MPKLRVLSGPEVLRILREFGFEAFSQKGSHVKVRRILGDGQAQTLTIPNHPEIDRGTLHAIFRQACRFIEESRLRARFFAD
jgi:predicted RNA binding protein YcfA (HicA-like mRNA interferase family)